LPISVIAAETVAPPKTPAATPRIGLVLSGGGARGLAHVGVLKVLEELRVPVHCITGTSMGAIVGGAYASESSAARLEQMVRQADWDVIFRDRPPRAEIASRRKVDDYKTLFAPEYGVKDGAPRASSPASRSRRSSAGLPSQPSGLTISRRFPFPTAQLPPISRPGRRSSSIAAASAVPCAQACPSREGWRRWRSTGACWLTAASRTTCP
jgi:hypothetical protein